MIQINIYTKDYDNLEEFLNQDKSILDELKKEIKNFVYSDFISLVKLINDWSDDDGEDGEQQESYLETTNYIFYTLKYVRPYETIYDDSIAIVDKELKRIEDQKIELKLNTKNKSTWLEFFKNKSLDELKAELLKYKFPKKN
jgi:hypothetical protein